MQKLDEINVDNSNIDDFIKELDSDLTIQAPGTEKITVNVTTGKNSLQLIITRDRDLKIIYSKLIHTNDVDAIIFRLMDIGIKEDRVRF